MDASSAQLLVACGAAAVAIAAVLWALRVTDGARGVARRLEDQTHALESKLQRSDAIFAAFPGVALIWEPDEGVSVEGEWGQPRVYGSPLALASLLRFAEAGSGEDPAIRILRGLSAFKGVDTSGREALLARALAKLRTEGQPFTLRLPTPGGSFVEIDGRTAGPRAVLWITDAGVKGVEEGAALGRLEEARQIVARDPTAFLEMLAGAPFLAWRLSPAGKLEWANQAYVAALEAKSLDQAIGRNLMLDAFVADQARRAFESGAMVEETRAIVVGGDRRTLQVQLFPVSGGLGGMAFDVTEMESAREALARSVKAHDQTLDALAEGVAIFGPDRRLTFFNRAFAALWGLESAFLAQRPTHAALLDALKEKRKLPAHANYAEWRANELLAYQDLAELPETLWQLPEGRTLRVARQRHPGGGLLMIFSDITNETTLKGRYAHLLQVQRAAMDKLHEGVVVFGLDGRCRLSNSAFHAMWRLDPEEAGEGMEFDRMVELCRPLHHEAEEWAAIRSRITDPSPIARQEHRGEMRRSDGAVIRYLTRPLPDGATLVAFLDVTATRKVEEALRDRAEAFEAADRLKTEFVQHVSYQLRTPLQTIHGYAEVLANFMAGPLNDRQRDQIRIILAASESLSKLIDDILDVAMIEANHLELDLQEVNLNEVLQEAASMVAPKAREADVALALEWSPAIGALTVDAKRLKQIVLNLVSNALRASEKGDTVTIGADRAEGSVRIWVTDTGRGIPFDAQAQAFNQFVSGDRAGAGLGLPLVRSFVELHQGWVSLGSAPGRGTTVTCHFPTTATPPGPPPPLSGTSETRLKRIA